MLNNENLERETGGLFETMKTYGLSNGLLLYYDKDIKEEQIPGEITIMPVWKWLVQNG